MRQRYGRRQSRRGFDADREQGNPSWSPDGRQVCYGDVPTRFGIPDGGERLHIHDITTGTVSDVPGSEGLWTCRWSPDGRYIAGLRISLGSQQMMINVLDTKRLTWRALTDAHHVGEPSWSPDSRFIYYNTISGPQTLRRVRVWLALAAALAGSLRACVACFTRNWNVCGTGSPPAVKVSV